VKWSTYQPSVCTELSEKSYPTFSIVIPAISSTKTWVVNYIKKLENGVALHLQNSCEKLSKLTFPITGK
jgi:hypothetical protein